MQAVIVDIVGLDAVALKHDGEFIKIKNNNYSLGQQIDVKKSKSNIIQFSRRISAAAAAFVLVLGGTAYGNSLWNSPVSYVSLDINPSIEYSLNAFDRVIEVDGVNDDGDIIVASLGKEVKNKGIADAITLTVEALEAENYITVEEQNYIVIGVYSEKEKALDSVKSKVDSYIPDEEKSLSVSTVTVTKEVRESAENLGVSAGKLEYITEMTSQHGTMSDDDAKEFASYSVAKLNQTKEALEAGATIEEALAELEEEVAATTEELNKDDVPVDSASSVKGEVSAEQTSEEAVTGDVDNASPVQEVRPDENLSGDSDKDVIIPEPIVVEPEPIEPDPVPVTETGDSGEATTPEKKDDIIDAPETETDADGGNVTTSPVKTVSSEKKDTSNKSSKGDKGLSQSKAKS